MRKALALVLCAALVTTGCASASGVRMQAQTTPSVVNAATMADYAQRIPAGSRVRVERTTGETLRGTLIKATPQAIVVQKNTRVPEPPLEVPVDSIARLTLDGHGNSTAKAIGIGIAAGVGTFFGILAILYATFDD